MLLIVARSTSQPTNSCKVVSDISLVVNLGSSAMVIRISVKIRITGERATSHIKCHSKTDYYPNTTAKGILSLHSEH